MHRRTLLRLAGMGALLPSALLAACRRAASMSGETSAVPGEPLPLTAEPIEAGLPVEDGATLRVYQWREYLSRDVLDRFERRYRDHGVRIETESFHDAGAAITRITHNPSEFDVFFPDIDTVGSLARGGLLQPLQHDELPNMANIWPELRTPAGPAYDPGMRYTTPYTAFASGIGWRDGDVPGGATPAEVGFDALWNPDIRAPIGIYDDYREALSMALVREGIADVNGATAAQLDRAAGALIALARMTDLSLTRDGAYDGLPEGEFAMHQAWSGDIISGRSYGLAEGAEHIERLRFWRPTTGPAIVGVDLMAIMAGAKHPVLAHHFLNYMLEFEVAMENFTWNGYQPPLVGSDPEAFADPDFPYRRMITPGLTPAIVGPDDLARHPMLLPLSPEADAEWHASWDRFVAAAGR